MAKLFKNLMGAIFIAFVALITWDSLAIAQKHWVFSKLGIQFDRTISAPTNNQASNQPFIEVKEAVSNLINENTSSTLQKVKQTFEQHTVPSLCLKTNTRPISSADKTSIYRWTDKNGHVHFSDNQPKQQTSSEITERYATAKQYFQMNLTSPEYGLPSLLGEQLERDVNAIYGYLSDRMEKQHLRQVDLNLKVFNTPEGFETYRLAHAPMLKSVAGFYTSLNNEAVVMQQRFDPQTRSIARHEATHVINAGLFGHSPIWFNEGIAEYFGSADYAELKSGSISVSGPHLNYLSSLLTRNQLPSLHHYLSLSGSEWRSQDPRTMYAMAWSIIYLLQNHHEGERFTRKLLAQLAENPCTTLDAKDFWNNHYAGGLVRFESRWQAMLQSTSP